MVVPSTLALMVAVQVRVVSLLLSGPLVMVTLLRLA